MAARSTSIPEQALFFYVKQIFPDAISRKRIPDGNGKKYEADIFVPSARVAIEYNGSYWHKNRLEKDIEKNKFLASIGVFSIIVCEGIPQPIPIKNGIILIHATRKANGLHMNEVITEVLHELSKHTSDRKQRDTAEHFQLAYDQYEEKYPEILKSIFVKPCKDNVTKNCIYSMWDEEKNRGIDPTFIPQNTSAKFWFRCPDGHSFRLSLRDWKDPFRQYEKCDQNCDVCAFNICPFLSSCPYFSEHVVKNLRLVTNTCQYIENHIWSCILGECEWPQKYGSQLHMMITNTNSGLEMELLRKYFDPETTDEEKRRIKYAIVIPLIWRVMVKDMFKHHQIFQILKGLQH